MKTGIITLIFSTFFTMIINASLPLLSPIKASKTAAHNPLFFTQSQQPSQISLTMLNTSFSVTVPNSENISQRTASTESTEDISLQDTSKSEFYIEKPGLNWSTKYFKKPTIIQARKIGLYLEDCQSFYDEDYGDQPQIRTLKAKDFVRINGPIRQMSSAVYRNYFQRYHYDTFLEIEERSRLKNKIGPVENMFNHGRNDAKETAATYDFFTSSIQNSRAKQAHLEPMYKKSPDYIKFTKSSAGIGL